MTIKLTITQNFAAQTVLADSTKTPVEVLQEQEIEVNRGQWNLDGFALGLADMNTPLDNLGVGERAYLTNVTKTDNA